MPDGGNFNERNPANRKMLPVSRGKKKRMFSISTKSTATRTKLKVKSERTFNYLFKAASYTLRMPSSMEILGSQPKVFFT